MKLVNNVLLAFTAEGVANSLALARQLGVETSAVTDSLRRGTTDLRLGVRKTPPDR